MGEIKFAPGITLGVDVRKIRARKNISGLIYEILGFLSVILFIGGLALFFMKILQASLVIMSTCLLINIINMFLRQGNIRVKITNLVLTIAIIILIIANMQLG